MVNLTHIFHVDQKVYCRLDNGDFEESIVKEVYEDHLIIDVPSISDHCWYEEGFNLGRVYPIDNFI